MANQCLGQHVELRQEGPETRNVAMGNMLDFMNILILKMGMFTLFKCLVGSEHRWKWDFLRIPWNLNWDPDFNGVLIGIEHFKWNLTGMLGGISQGSTTIENHLTWFIDDFYHMSTIFHMISACFAAESRMVTGHIVSSRAALDLVLRADGLGSKTSIFLMGRVQIWIRIHIYLVLHPTFIVFVGETTLVLWMG